MKKILSFVLILLLVLSSFQSAFAISTSVVGSESVPGKLDIKNVNGIGKNIGTDFFGGAMTFSYPFSFPSGSRGMTPNLSLSYASNNSDAFSPYGYGFSLSLPRIQRSAKKGVSELYLGDEYSAFGSDLIREGTGSINRYRSKNGSDLNLYALSGSSWIVQTPNGKTLILGSVPASRIANPENPQQIYAWLVDEERDMFGHSIRYSYFIDGGQPYIRDIFFGYERGDKNPLYAIHFDYIDKSASLSSYRTQFEVSTKKLLSMVSLKVNSEVKHTYSFVYDNPDNTISHLVSIAEEAEGVTLPRTLFEYGEGQFQHMITSVDNNRGGKTRFEYAPSTGYRDNSGSLLNTNLPFTVMTLSKQIFEDSVTGISSEESYSYSGGHYYYDSTDLWGREYVGFGEVTISDDKAKKILFFHQSQTSGASPFKYQDHISKKGLIYKTDTIDKSNGKILKQELTKYDSRVLTGERRLVYPMQKINIEFDSSGSHRDTATTYEYDNDGNLTKELQVGLVNANLTDGTFIDIAGDTFSTERVYISSPIKNLYNFPASEKVYGWSGELLSSSYLEYDNTSSGLTLGLLTTKKRQNVQDKSIITTEKTVYSPTGLPIEQYDALNNRTTSTYDTRDISITSSKNPLGWETRFVYDYTIGKPIQTTNQNGVISTTLFDGFGRVLEERQNTGSGDILLTRTSYDDVYIPNSITSTQYYDATGLDSKITKSYTDGWGRIIATISTTEKPGQFSVSHVRYDDDGNPIYAGYPVFVSTDSFDSTLVLPGVTDGESYRAKSPGMSFTYDALDRIISQRDARGVTEKTYSPGKEIIKDVLGNITEARYDAYGNLVSFVEKINNRDIVTKYSYDAFGRPVSLIDANSNPRSWNYDGFGRLKSATDLHTPGDTTYGGRQYEYDTLGRVKKYTNAKNEIVSYTYDVLSRMTRESYPASNSGTFIRDYVYDLGTRSLGTLSRIVDPSSTVNYGYDPLGRKMSETRIIEGKTYTLSYGYNSASVLTDILYPDGGKTKYTYKRGFIEGVGYTDSKNTFTQIISDISYAPNSTMKSIRYGNGVVKNMERDAKNNYRLARATASASDGTKILDTNYSYDAISNIVGITENGIEPLRKTISYTYDQLARLSSANYSYSIAGYGRDKTKNFTYTYDDIGNIMSSSEVGSYSYAGTNYTNPHAVTMAGDTSYSYDQAGNTTLRTTSNTSGNSSFNFSYSPYGEMTSSVKDGMSTSYTYDASRRRITKTTIGLTEHHVVDGYEVEYESGALVPVASLMLPATNTGMMNTGVTGTGTLLITGSGTIEKASSGSISNTGTTNTTSTGATSTGSTSSGITQSILISNGTVTTQSGIVFSGITSLGTISSSGILSSSGTLLTNTGPTQSGTILISSGVTHSGIVITNSGITNTGVIIKSGVTNSGTTNTGSTSTGIVIGTTSTGISSTGIINTGTVNSGTISLGSTTSTGSLPLSSGSIQSTGSVSGTPTVIAYTGVISTGSTLGSGSYIVVAGYAATEMTGALSIGLTTTLTHIYLGYEKIATFQSQTDDTPKTSDDDKFIFHISDHLNSSSLDLSSTGIILQATDYQSFGKMITYQVTSERTKGKKGGYKNKYLFANKQLDTETDLQYFEKRYYDNKIGRFTTEDPVFWEVSLTKRPGQYFIDPQQWNSYSYVRNNPVNMVDPTGEALKVTSENLQDSYFLKKNDASGAFLRYLFDISQMISGSVDKLTMFYHVTKNGSYGDIKSKKGNALGGKYAFSSQNIDGSKSESNSRYGVIMSNTFVPLDILGNFTLGYNAQKAGLGLGFTEFSSLMYQIKNPGKDMSKSIKDEIFKDWKSYRAGYLFAKRKDIDTKGILFQYIQKSDIDSQGAINLNTKK